METQTIKTKASGKRYNEQFKKDTVDYWIKNKYFNILEARRNIFEYIEVFYNRQRRHSFLGYKSPIKFEQEFYVA